MDTIEERMVELMEPIDQQILSCQTQQDLLLMACSMLQRTRELFDVVLGPEGRMKMFKDYADKIDPTQALH